MLEVTDFRGVESLQLLKQRFNLSNKELRANIEECFENKAYLNHEVEEVLEESLNNFINDIPNGPQLLSCFFSFSPFKTNWLIIDLLDYFDNLKFDFENFNLSKEFLLKEQEQLSEQEKITQQAKEQKQKDIVELFAGGVRTPLEEFNKTMNEIFQKIEKEKDITSPFLTEILQLVSNQEGL